MVSESVHLWSLPLCIRIARTGTSDGWRAGCQLAVGVVPAAAGQGPVAAGCASVLRLARMVMW